MSQQHIQGVNDYIVTDSARRLCIVSVNNAITATMNRARRCWVRGQERTFRVQKRRAAPIFLVLWGRGVRSSRLGGELFVANVVWHSSAGLAVHVTGTVLSLLIFSGSVHMRSLAIPAHRHATRLDFRRQLLQGDGKIEFALDTVSDLEGLQPLGLQYLSAIQYFRLPEAYR